MSANKLQDFVAVLNEAGFSKQAIALEKYAMTPFEKIQSISDIDQEFQNAVMQPAKLAWCNVLAEKIWNQIEGNPAVTKIDKKCGMVAKFLVNNHLVCTEVETESNPLPDFWLETDRSAIYAQILESFSPAVRQ